MKTHGAQIAVSPGAKHKIHRNRLKPSPPASRSLLLTTSLLVLTALLPSATGSPFFFDLLLSPFRSRPSYQRPSYTPSQPSYNTNSQGGFKLPSLPSNGPFNFRLPRLPALPDIGGPIKSFISGLTGRIYFWTSGLKTTLSQCHETSQIFMDNEQILRVGKR